MNSPGHRANILGSQFTKIGVGYVNGSRPYWTQMFTN
ncbi:MAG TPA: CAP domain-containing protein, partial [Sedimentibacter sp.]|nr:CAP domain-containing protein [Sedimentibacter sp.]